jgi:SAM-dependent methyltransferase
VAEGGARGLYDRIVGTPFVYDYLRPLVVGGIDMSPAYQRAQTTDDAVVLDVGCGTGDALRYLSPFRRYVGFDTDERAIASARVRYGDRPGVAFEARPMRESDVCSIRPTVVLLMGLLHHLPDYQVVELLRAVRGPDTVRRIVTQDIVLLDSEPMSNFLARLDRGRECRTRAGYESLAAEAGWIVDESIVLRSHPTRGLAKYLVMVLTP